MNRVRTHIATTAAGVLALGALGMAPAAAAPVAAEVERDRDGRCSAASIWELDLEKAGKRIEVDVDVKATRAGQRWNVRVWHNGKRFVKVTRVTNDDGEWEVDRTVRNRKGRDRITFKAVSSTGEVCRGTVRI